MSSIEVIPARLYINAASPSAKVVPEATVTTPVDVLTAETTEPEVLSNAPAEISLCPTASPILKCLAIAAGTVKEVVAPAEAIYAVPASSSSFISLMWSI